jgi:DNA-directed RNA polymerase subunit RPC12/RpoP
MGRVCRHCGGAVLVTKTKKQLLLACTLCKHREVKLFTSKGG